MHIHVSEPVEPPSARRSQREFYRVRYPLRERPSFHSPEVSALVADCSEMGMELIAPQIAKIGLPPGTRLTGTIHFRHAGRTTVECVVQRWTPTGIAVRFERASLPWATVQAEERAILARYPR